MTVPAEAAAANSRPSRPGQLVHPAARALQFALPGQLFPNGRSKLVRRRDRHDAGSVAAAHRAAADPRLIVELRQLQSLSKCLQRRFSSCGFGPAGGDASEANMECILSSDLLDNYAPAEADRRPDGLTAAIIPHRGPRRHRPFAHRVRAPRRRHRTKAAARLIFSGRDAIRDASQ